MSFPQWHLQNRAIRLTEESRVAYSTWRHIIEQTEQTPGPHQQFFLQYLHEKFRKEWPTRYAKIYGERAEQAKSKTDNKVV